MSAFVESLPWSATELKSQKIEWPKLRELADATVENVDARTRLVQELDVTFENYCANQGARGGGKFLGLLTVVAEAAQRLNESGRGDLARRILAMLKDAAEQRDEFLTEALERVAGRLGSAIVRPALEQIEGLEPDYRFWLSAVFLLPAGVENEQARTAAIEFCRRGIARERERGKLDYADVLAQNLADLRDHDSLPVLRSLYEETKSVEFEEAIRVLEHGPHATEVQVRHSWRMPVEKWVPQHLEWSEEWEQESRNNAMAAMLAGQIDRLRFNSFGSTTVDGEVDPGESSSGRVPRNDPCLCGSGKKYKKCCGKPR